MKHKWDKGGDCWTLQRPGVWVVETRLRCEWYVGDCDGRRYADGHCPTLEEAKAAALDALKRLEGESW